MILDTTFVIDFFKNSRPAVLKLKNLDEKGETILITSITIFEIWQGIGPEKEGSISSFAESIEILDFDSKSAKRAGEIHSGLKSKGALINVGDSMIAGIAMHNGQTLLTRDEHFARVKGLMIETY